MYPLSMPLKTSCAPHEDHSFCKEGEYADSGQRIRARRYI